MIKKTLRQLGVPQHILGYDYLAEAVELVIRDHSILQRITKELYPTLAKHHMTTASRIERAIRHAVEIGCDNTRMEGLADELFCNSINSYTGRPTNAHFIAAVAEHVQDQAVASR
jgi:two-component system response regulator (stage 0 sporulation protein A)